MYKRVSVYVSECVCCTHLFSFFPLAFLMVNYLSLVSRCFLFLEMLTILFSLLLPFVSFCRMHFLFYVYCRVLPDVLSLMFFH